VQRKRAEEEEVVTIGSGGAATTCRPDVQVREPWTLKEPGATGAAANPPETPVTEPIRVFVDAEIERWLEIRDDTGRLMTAVEGLSPGNKLESLERGRYHLLNYRLALDPPLAPEEAAWVNQLLREARLL